MCTYGNSVAEVKDAIITALDDIEGDFDSETLCQALNECKSYAHTTDYPPTRKLYYIQDSRQYVGNALLWWAKNSAGYTTDLDKAGAYTRKEALKIAQNRSTDILWPVDYINKIASKTVDMQVIDRSKSRKINTKGDKS